MTLQVSIATKISIFSTFDRVSHTILSPNGGPSTYREFILPWYLRSAKVVKDLFNLVIVTHS